ncbi:hypothetical protein [Mariniflexile ostreae]
MQSLILKYGATPLVVERIFDFEVRSFALKKGIIEGFEKAYR